MHNFIKGLKTFYEKPLELQHDLRCPTFGGLRRSVNRDTGDFMSMIFKIVNEYYL